MITLENLIELRNKYERLLKENKELRKEQQTISSIFPSIEERRPSQIILPAQRLDESYLDFVKRIKSNENPDSIVKDIKASINAKQILEGILIYLFTEIETAEKLYTNCTLEERELIYEEIQILKQQFIFYKEISKQISKQPQIIIPQTERKNLIYLRSSMNNPLIYSDFLSISREYYPSFLELFSSLEDGTMKNLKFLTSIRHYEVKGFQTRIMFAFAPNDCVILLSAFIKKTDDYNKAITALVNQRLLTFNKQKKEIFKLCEEKSYLEEQRETTEKVYKLLRGE